MRYRITVEQEEVRQGESTPRLDWIEIYSQVRDSNINLKAIIDAFNEETK